MELKKNLNINATTYMCFMMVNVPKYWYFNILNHMLFQYFCQSKSKLISNLWNLVCFIVLVFIFFHVLLKISNISIKEGCLFVLLVCHIEIFQTTRPPPHSQYSLTPKLSTNKGAPRWFANVWNYGARVIKYWIILSLKIQ
jgi:hypothetical protein